MKICWDNLEGLKYNKKTGKWHDKRYVYYIYKEKCEICGEPFLAQVSNKVGYYCSKICAGKGYNTKERKLKKSKNQKGEKNSNWKGELWKKHIPLYDTYASQIEWCEEVRRSPKDKNILEVRCFKCNKWFIPKDYNANNRSQYLKGNYNYESRFYCSDECRYSCSIYGKSPEQLMREDAIRAGRLEWLKLDREVQPELKKLVLKRDGYQCVKCGSTGTLHCHHIYPVSTNPLESADIDNCITLCYTCHKKVHQKDGCRYEQLRIEVC